MMQQPEALANVTRIAEHAVATACFGPPASAGDRTMIPVAEVMYGMGFGWGGGQNRGDGSEGSGGGGGGGSRVRGIAVIEIGPEGVRVHPIIDQTAVALAGITLATAVVAITARTLTKLVRG
jgi:uncharacterized spore protein YtfJ